MQIFCQNFNYCQQRSEKLNAQIEFLKLIIGKIQVFSTSSYEYLHRYTQICERGAQFGPPPLGKQGWNCKNSTTLLWLHKAGFSHNDHTTHDASTEIIELVMLIVWSPKDLTNIQNKRILVIRLIILKLHNRNQATALCDLTSCNIGVM